MCRLQVVRLLSAFAALAVFSVSASASTASGYSQSGGFATVSPGSTSTVGLRFLVHEALSVESLGVIDFNDDGLSEAHDVGLWTDTGVLLASTTVPAGAGAALVDGFRYAAIAPVGLSAGQVYRVGAMALSEVYYNGVSYASPPALTVLDQSTSYVGAGPTLSFPNDFTFGPGSAVANFQYVPEPASLSLLALGGLALIRRGRLA